MQSLTLMTVVCMFLFHLIDGMKYLQSAIDFQGEAASQIRWEQFASCCWAI